MLQIACLDRVLKPGELDRPQSLSDCLVSLFVLLAGPERLNDILDADDSTVAQQLLNQGVVADWLTLRLLRLNKATLANDILECLLGGLAIGDVVCDR